MTNEVFEACKRIRESRIYQSDSSKLANTPTYMGMEWGQNEMIQDVEIGGRFASLSSKQRAVLELLAQNRTSKEIARELNVSPYAVEQRIQTIRSKFGPVPRRELVRIYTELAGAFQRPIPCASRAINTERPGEPFVQAAEPASSVKEGKLRFFLGFFAGLSVGLFVAMASILITYQIVSSA